MPPGPKTAGNASLANLEPEPVSPNTKASMGVVAAAGGRTLAGSGRALG